MLAQMWINFCTKPWCSICCIERGTICDNDTILGWGVRGWGQTQAIYLHICIYIAGLLSVWSTCNYYSTISLMQLRTHMAPILNIHIERHTDTHTHTHTHRERDWHARIQSKTDRHTPTIRTHTHFLMLYIRYYTTPDYTIQYDTIPY